MVKTRAGIQSVELGFALMDALARAQGPLMLRDLAAAGRSAARARRCLVSFQRLGLVSQDPASARYDLGPAALRMGLAAITRLDAVKLARERLPALMQHIGHTLAIAVRGNHGPTIVHWEESPQSATVNLRRGDVMPLLSSATGRCFAAHVSREAFAPLLRTELTRARQLGRTDLPCTQVELAQPLKDVRAHGMARVVDTLLPGIAGFCAPVFDCGGHLALGIVAMGSVATVDTDWRGAVATAPGQAARQLSHALGHLP